MYLYEGHMGGLYTSEDYLDFDELYCEQCGDSDSCLGNFETENDLREILLDYYEYDKTYEYDEYWTEEDHEADKKEIFDIVEKHIKEFMG